MAFKSDVYQQPYINEAWSDTHMLVRQCADKLGFAASKLCLTVEQLDGQLNIALLEGELRESRDRGLTFAVNLQRLVAAALSVGDILLPLVQREALIDHRQHVRAWAVKRAIRLGKVVEELRHKLRPL